MNKKVTILVSIVVGLLLVGGVMAYAYDQREKKEQEQTAMQKKAADQARLNMKKKEDAVAVENEELAKESDVMSKQGSYVTLADYDSDPAMYADSKKVYFFHASWCPICRGIDEAITADTSKIPAGVTMIKTDFDSSTDLRQKYGVTTQYTFVQVDSNGNETAQWSATSLQKAIDGIES